MTQRVELDRNLASWLGSMTQHVEPDGKKGGLSKQTISLYRKELLGNKRFVAGKYDADLSLQDREKRIAALHKYATEELQDESSKRKAFKFIEEQEQRSADLATTTKQHENTRVHITVEAQTTRNHVDTRFDRLEQLFSVHSSTASG